VSLLLAQFFIIVSYAFFLHTHILNDGTRIVHAHFFQETEETNPDSTNNTTSDEQPVNHEHTSFSYSFFSNFNLLFNNKQAEINYLPTCRLLSQTIDILVLPFSPENFSSLRAPPSNLV
jgi:hypothetical protein